MPKQILTVCFTAINCSPACTEVPSAGILQDSTVVQREMKEFCFSCNKTRIDHF